ncbi:MAG: Flp pilus assembly complex ATPase component TadA [Chloroflexi bacterium]|nr:Flp pilus assembly complex ATPase component TadA [Chloroflexota bacterium]
MVEEVDAVSKDTSNASVPGAAEEPKGLGQMLVESNLITQTQLEHAQELERQQGRKLSEVLVEQDFVSVEDLTAMLSLRFKLPLIDLKRHTIQPEALKLIPESMARKHNLVPLDVVGDALVVVMSDPGDIQAINDLVAQSGMQIEPTVGVPDDIREAIDRNYKATSEIEKEIGRYAPSGTGLDDDESQITSDLVGDAPIVRTVDLLIAQAIRERSSDIHLEPQRDRLRVRYRVDGVLREAMSLPLNVHPPLVSRVKILADMNIAEKRLPQDGQMSVNVDGREVDIRVATSETAYGETVALRILEKSRLLLDLPQLGFLPDASQRYSQMLHSPFGLVLVAGPTGSGKTTTLYASVNEFDRGTRNIVTIEDPVEYLFDDINQIQVNPRAGITFASGLRAIMRLDPDIILIGEMRDNDTASTGVQAALTGHLVLASIHGNDASGVILRLENLGIEPFQISSALLGVVAQRMVRRICPHCSSLSERPVEEQMAYERELGEKRTKFYCGTGCNFCGNTGYLGRTGIFEIMLMSDSIRLMVTGKAMGSEIRDQAIKEGMVPMIRDGMLKVREGITTPSEVMLNAFSIQ